MSKDRRKSPPVRRDAMGKAYDPTGHTEHGPLMLGLTVWLEPWAAAIRAARDYAQQ